MKSTRISVALCAGLVLATGVGSVVTSPAAASEDANTSTHGYDEKFLSTLSWRCIGPPRGGRATACVGLPDDPMTYYMGATGGGVWKTANAGLTWEPISDEFFKTGSIGAIAVATSDPNVVYVGTGEACPRGNFSHGDGIYKSIDAGKTWRNIGLDDTRQIGCIRVHPNDPDLVYVAALGHIFGSNQQRGVFRSQNGGETWENVLFVNDETGAVDLAMDPLNPRVLYAAFWQVSRTPWSLESGGPGSGLYKSTDGGDTWNELTSGLPEGVKGKIGVTVSPVKPDRVWAIIEADDGGVFRSDNAGETWRRVNRDRSLRQRAWYYTHIYADSQDVDTVYVLNVSFHKSTDGGKSFDTTLRVPHGDNHDLWINPDNNLNMVEANDGGANVSFDGGKSWTRQDTLPTAQFYHVTTDNQFPYRVYGAQQDNSTISVSSRAAQFRTGDMYSVGGGESGYIAVRPDDTNIVYAGSYDGHLTRYDHRYRQSRNITVWPDNPMGAGVETMKYRFQWTFPIVISPHDPNTLYVGGNLLFKSTNEGQSWEAISPDLTTNDRAKQRSSGGPITQDNTSVEYYCTIFAMAESPHEPGVIWVGSDDGLVHITKDGGQTWSEITPVGLGEWSLISLIEASPHDPATAYLAVNRYKMDDFQPYVFKTNNYGKTWKQINSGIDDGAFVRAVREDPERRGLLYAGTETGMYISFDDGDHWQSLQLTLPAAPITDLVVKDDDLVVATQGRSFWILSDLSVLRQLTRDVKLTDAHIFTPGLSYRAGGDTVDVYYYLAEKPETPVTLEFLDLDDDVIRSFASKESSQSDEADETEAPRRRRGGGSRNAPAEAGVNRFRWDMRYADAQEVPGAVMWGGSVRGPRAVPGAYQARLTVGEQTLDCRFEILPDPRLDATPDDYRAQFDLLIQIRDAVSDAHTAINQIRNVREQIKTATSKAKEIAGMDSIVEAGKTLNKKLTEIEVALIQTKSKSRQDPLNFPIRLNNKIAALTGVVSRSNGRPTTQSYDVFDDLNGQVQVQLAKLIEIMEIDVPAFNQLVRDHDVPAVWVEEPKSNDD
ncbi:MAG: hypothetical protein V3T53_09665 [Phycisphaerales bacterium]